MTRTLQIVNLSNWDGEDYEVELENHDGSVVVKMIKPGESVMVMNSHKEGEVQYRPVQRRDEEGSVIDEPFYDENGVQVTPSMDISFR